MKGRVLIVDDSVTVRSALRGVLSSVGFTTILCDNLGSARRALGEEDLSLVILDVTLPDGDGVDLLAELRASPRTEQLPVLMLSSEAAVTHRLKGLNQGANDYVGKPYDPAYLVKRACELTQVAALDATPRLVAAGKRRRLLLVDDNLCFRHVASEELRKDGHDIILAESGEEALELLRVQAVDCVLLDLVMPGLSGIEVARAVRALPRLAGVPLLMLTARLDPKIVTEALDAGVDAFCTKSTDFELLRAQVRNELRRRLADDAGTAASAPSALPPNMFSQPPAPPALRTASLLDEVVARSGLSSVISCSTISRACRRAGVDAQALDVTGLRKALPNIREALRVFLPEKEMEGRMEAIEALVQSPRGSGLRQVG